MNARKTLVNSILALLLAMPSLAYGELVLMIRGVEAPAPPKKTFWVYGDTEPVGMNLSAGHAIECYDLAFVLTDLGEEPPDPYTPDFVFHWSSIGFPTNFDYPANIISNDEQYVSVAAAQISSPAVLGPAVLVEDLGVQNLEMLGLSRLDLIVEGFTIIDGEEIPVGTVLDSTIVFEVPEPATICLLGLGSLALLRRRQAGNLRAAGRVLHLLSPIDSPGGSTVMRYLRRGAWLLVLSAWLSQTAFGGAIVVCNGTVCGGNGPRQYWYEVTYPFSPSWYFDLLMVGSNDPNPAHYTNVWAAKWVNGAWQTNDGWEWDLHSTGGPVLGWEHHMPATPHGGGPVAPDGYCTNLARWFCGGVEVQGLFGFGFDNPNPPEDVSWGVFVPGLLANWAAPVGTGEGPVHGPTPEPATLSLLMLGGLALLRRRR